MVGLLVRTACSATFGVTSLKERGDDGEGRRRGG